MAHSQRGWTGARTPSAIKRVRQTERRRLINQPRRTVAKTMIIKAIGVATDAAANGGNSPAVQEAVQNAVSALDRAAKIGAIHHNAANRRKSRLMLKVNAVLGGEGVSAPAKVARSTGKAAAAKQAKARIAASRAVKAKGAQTAAGKARAALARTTRSNAADESQEMAQPVAEKVAVKARPATKAKAPAAKAKTAKTAKAKASAAKASAAKSTTKATAAKSAPRSTTKKS